jgi:hypothetical protein
MVSNWMAEHFGAKKKATKMQKETPFLELQQIHCSHRTNTIHQI